MNHNCLCRISCWSIVNVFVLALPTLGTAQGVGLDEYLETRTKALLEARINQTSNSNQSEAPSSSANTTSLVDQTSVSDLFGFALDLAQFASGVPDSSKTNSVAMTTTPYALYCASTGADPLNPEVYNAFGVLRRFSFAYGYDDPSQNKTAPLQMYGLKILLINGRDAAGNPAQLAKITEALQAYAGAHSRMVKKVQELLYLRSGQADSVSLEDFTVDSFDQAFARLSESERSDIDEIILSELGSFEALEKTTTDAIETIRSAPQLSFSVTMKKEGAITRSMSLALQHEYGIGNNLQFLANGSYQETRLDSGGTANGGKVSVEVQFSTGDANLSFRKPLQLSFAASGNWMKEALPLYQWQLKVAIPIAKGMDLPLAFTWSKGNLIEEGDFSVQLGFGFDIARLIAH